MQRSYNGYHQRVNRVLDYVAQHLDESLTLARLAQISCFSPFHFHRIFQAITGETVNNHVRRVRLERAAMLMRANPQKRITDVALDTGFAGTAEFSRAFKNHFGHTASSWDRRSPLENSKISQAPESLPFHTVEELERWKSESKDLRIALRKYRPFRYVYAREHDAYGNLKLVDHYKSLMAWLAKRGTAVRDISVIGMSQDDPSITPAGKYRYDLGIAFRTRKPAPEECSNAGFSFRDFDAQQIVSVHCVGDLGHVGRAWQYLYRIWLPASRYEPANLPAMEIFEKLPEEIGWETFDLHVCIPVVKPL